MTSLSLHSFSRQVVEIMPFMFREFAKREDNDLMRGKISCPQMVTLDYVLREGEVKMTDLARLLAVNMSTSTAMVDRLIRDKMLSRRRDQEDRRVVWIRITPKGKKVVRQILEQKTRSIEDIFGHLTETERKQYLAILNKVKAKFIAKSL
jgi:MarR family transcriptional regulator, organic hydroperoxide resistance regulator